MGGAAWLSKIDKRLGLSDRLQAWAIRGRAHPCLDTACQLLGRDQPHPDLIGKSFLSDNPSLQSQYSTLSEVGKAANLRDTRCSHGVYHSLQSPDQPAGSCPKHSLFEQYPARCSSLTSKWNSGLVERAKTVKR